MKAKRSMACLLVLLMLAGLAIPTVFADDSTVHIADAKDLKKLAENEDKQTRPQPARKKRRKDKCQRRTD